MPSTPATNRLLLSSISEYDGLKSLLFSLTDNYPLYHIPIFFQRQIPLGLRDVPQIYLSTRSYHQSKRF